MNEWENLIRAIKDYLATYAVRVDMDKGEASRAAENFYCNLLNLILGCHLENMNLVRANYPAIDLGDKKEGLGIQVTSTATRKKVQDTLDAMFRNGVEQEHPHLVMLITNKWVESRKAFRMDGKCQFDPEKDIWDTDWLLNRIGSITDLDHLRRILTHLKENLHIAERKELLQRLKPRSSLDKHAFVGREEKCREIAAAFESGKQVVFLSGLGGIGKTELAVHYAARYAIRTYQVTFSGSFAQTLRDSVAPNLTDFCAEGKNEAQIEREAMDALGQCDLLILDNADQANLTYLTKELNGLPMRVLVTTRISEKTAIRVKRMENDALYKIFARHGVNISVEQMDALIAAVDGHTMTVDMIARTLADDCCVVSPEDVCTAMSGGGMDEEDYPEIENGHDPEHRKIYGHLRALFRLQEMEDAGKQCLCCAALLPGDGMSLELFRNALTRTGKQALPGLVRRGWLQCENKLLTIHPVVRLVCRTELKPTEEKCYAFLERLWDQYNYKYYDKGQYRQLAEIFTDASVKLDDEKSVWALRSGCLWTLLGEPGKALEIHKEAAQKQEKRQTEIETLAGTYYNLGGSYDEQGDYENALKYHILALDIRVRTTPGNPYVIAQSYNGVGHVLGNMGEHELEKAYYLRALEIWRSILPEEHPEVAICYNNLGSCYTSLGDYSSALEALEKSLQIREKVLPVNHPERGLSHHNLGCLYDEIGDYEKALEQKVQAMELWEQNLPELHPYLAASYRGVGEIYCKLGNYKKSLECFLKEKEIQEKVLPSDLRTLAAIYNRVGVTYSKLGEHRQALKYKVKDAEICRQILPENHPDLAQSYINLANTYDDLGELEKALEYKLKILEIEERTLPTDHPDIAISCRNIAYNCAALDDLRTAVKYIRRAVEIAEKRLPEGYLGRECYQREREIMEVLLKFQKMGIKMPNPFKA